MITEAYIAGALDKAIFKEEDDFFIFERLNDSDYHSKPFNHFDLNSFLLAQPEITHYNNIEWEKNRLYDELSNDAEKQDALNLFLMGMDKSLSDALRREAMELLVESLSKNNEIKTFIPNRVFATKVPDEFDPFSAYQIADNFGSTILAKWYKDLSYANHFIITVRDAWKKTIINLGNQPDLNIELLDKEFTDIGIFSDFVLPLLSHDYKAIDNAIVLHADKLKESNIGQPAVFLSNFKKLVYDSLAITQTEIDKVNLDEIEKEDKKYDEESKGDFVVKFNKLIDTFKGKDRRKRENKKWRKLKVALLSKIYYPEEKVNKLVSWIKEEINERNIENAQKGLIKLVEYQDLRSEPRHLCKSLSDIAECLQKVNLIELSNYFAQKAIDIFPQDAVPYCILAENFRAEGKLEEALKKYEENISDFKNDVVPRTGKAETLRQMGRLGEALAVYNEAIQDFNNEVFPRTGKAETLRQMGSLDEALEIYNETIQVFKNEVVPRNGKAETLRQIGKLDEALAAYDETIQNFKNEVVPRTGKAETLRQMGRLDEALAAYDETIQNFKNEVVPRTGKAETLKQMGRLDEALEAYNEIIQNFKNDVVSQTGKAETLRQMGRLDEALEAYNKTIQNFKNDVVSQTGKAETLRQMGRLEEALAAYDKTIQNFKNEVVPKNGKAETLRQMGRLNEAKEMFDAIINDFPYNNIAKTARFVLLIQMGENLDEVEKQVQVNNPQSYDDWFLNHVHCMLLIKLNKIDEAIVSLEHGVEVIKDIEQLNYYRNALSYAYIKKRKYKDAVAQLKNEVNPRPVLRVLVTHAFAADGDLQESKINFNSIFKSPFKKIDTAAKYLSDRYDLYNQHFFPDKTNEELEKKIEDLEFELLTESYLKVA